jgi:hypothetical protein
LGPAALTSLRSHGFPIGMLRWVLPLALLIGLLAGLASWFMGRLGRRLSMVRAPKKSPAKAPAIYQPNSSDKTQPKSLFRSQPKVRRPK